MISAGTQTFALAGRLTAKACKIAQARAVRGAEPLRWRNAGWLWPLFVKD